MRPAIAFDLGDTLVEYAGLPLSWEPHYPEALRELSNSLGLAPSASRLERACEILRRYNTRLHPRGEEVGFGQILAELCGSLGAAQAVDELLAARAFFRIFRQRLQCFDDACETLTTLRARGWKTAIFTDVPYGMPKELVLEDVAAAGLAGQFDVLLTSVDVGFRKPQPQPLQAVARALSCAPAELTYVGNEKKDVEAALACGAIAILLDRHAHRPAWGQRRTLDSLRELLA